MDAPAISEKANRNQALTPCIHSEVMDLGYVSRETLTTTILPISSEFPGLISLSNPTNCPAYPTL
ncbi:MAG: hypothetical protein P8X74_07805 [Reinekea sp.]